MLWVLDQQCHSFLYFHHPLPAFCLEASTAELLVPCEQISVLCSLLILKTIRIATQ